MQLYLSPRKLVGAIAALIGAVGIFLLATPTAAYTPGLYSQERIGCGSALAPESFAACEDAIDSRRVWGWPLLVIGGLGIAGALFIQPVRRPTKPPKPQPE